MPKAIWEGAILAQSEDCVVIEGNQYFPHDSVSWERFEPSDTTTVCGWKGTANYYHVVVDGKSNRDAAWYYKDPFPAAKQIQGRVAFWRGVKVEP